MKNHYATLRLPNFASSDDVRQAYRRLVVQYHPDRNPNSPAAEAQTRRLNEAKEALESPAAKAAYDQRLRLHLDALRQVAVPRPAAPSPPKPKAQPKPTARPKTPNGNPQTTGPAPVWPPQRPVTAHRAKRPAHPAKKPMSRGEELGRVLVFVALAPLLLLLFIAGFMVPTIWGYKLMGTGGVLLGIAAGFYVAYWLLRLVSLVAKGLR